MSALPTTKALATEAVGSLSPQEHVIGAHLAIQDRGKPWTNQTPDCYADVKLAVGTAHTSIEVECFGRRTTGFPGDREQPAERGGLVIHTVRYEGCDITHLFTEDQLHELAEGA